MKAPAFRTAVLFALIVFFLSANRVSAQVPLEPAQMPARTLFYFIWRGAPSPGVRQTNAVMALWDDPGFAPARSALARSLLGNSEEKNSQLQLSQEELDEYSALLDNPFVLGYLGEPQKHANGSKPTPPEANAPDAQFPGTKAPLWNGIFFVYDRTGKEAILAKAIVRLRAQEKDPPQISEIVVGKVHALKVARKTGITYWAEHGKYALSASERPVLEELLSRLNANSPATPSLAQSPAYQEAKPFLGNSLLEFFVRVPSLKEFAPDPTAAGLRLRPLLDAAKLDDVHSFSGRLTLEGTKTHLQGAMFGNAAPGTIFDIWSAGQPAPASLAFVPADTVSYNATYLNFQGIYEVMKRILRSTFPPGQQQNADMIDSVLQVRLGVPLPDALTSLNGEFASFQTSPSMDSTRQIFFLGVRKKPEILKLIRNLAGDRIKSERDAGDTTFLKISLGGSQAGAGLAQWNFYHFAVTPTAILAASRLETLNELLARRAQDSSASSLAAVRQFETARSQFPEKLNGLSYFDFQKIDWPALRDRWTPSAPKISASAALSGSQRASQQPSAPQVPNWLSQVDPQVFPRHLHLTYSASWKDARGIHFEQWIE
ncbi:MAG TPA: hypothetical protein VOA64_21465 [Candidatus Dormibacteraeota bacterium]|nr:hypothetical protein [Candidatus Dormibacteraeota bacterium]